jgi:hypothetical protein
MTNSASMPACPHCHQPIIAQRFGVRLTPLKAEIFDRVKRAGDLGVSSIEIVSDVYADRQAVSSTTIKAHINQINDVLVSTDWRIVSDHRRWFLHKLAE